MVALLGTLAGIVGCVFIFININVTLICAAVTVVSSFINVVTGEQKGFISEIIFGGLGALIAVLCGGNWLHGVAIGLCVESVLLWLIGLVFLLLDKRK